MSEEKSFVSPFIYEGAKKSVQRFLESLMKKCNKCGEYKDFITGFGVDVDKIGHRRHECLACQKSMRDEKKIAVAAAEKAAAEAAEEAKISSNAVQLDILGDTFDLAVGDIADTNIDLAELKLSNERMKLLEEKERLIAEQAEILQRIKANKERA